MERFIGLWREIHRKEPSAVGRDPSGVADPSGLRDSWVLWRDPSEISIGLVERSIGFVDPSGLWRDPLGLQIHRVKG